MKKIKSMLLFAGASLLLYPELNAQPPQMMQQAQSKTETTKAKLPKYPPNETTTGTVTIDGQKLNYKAVAGTMPLLDNDEQDTTARMSFVAYFKDGVTDLSSRPVTFLYNGGPGSSTLWLHMGSFGPKRVVADGTTHLPGPPYKLVNNDYSLLDATDLVFIDAPGTGFGRIEKGKESYYYGVDQDALAFSQFIQRFITIYERWNSPKFLFGESYGTTRSAVLAKMLQQNSIDLNGVILLSQILNFGFSVDGPARDPGNNKPYELSLPTYAATAWFHNKLPNKNSNLQAFLKEVEQFAMNDYALALDKGAKLDAASFDKIANQLHQYIGLPVDYIKKANLRIDGGEFEQQLLSADELATGRLDTRFSGPISDPLAQRSFSDPQSDAISGAYVALLNDYMRKELKFGNTMVYRPNIYGRSNWDMKHFGSPGTLNVMGDLASAMKGNPLMKVMLATGYYDLATPFYEGVYELEHLPITSALQKNISYAFYESGHMVYLHVPSLKKLHDDVKQFINSSFK